MPGMTPAVWHADPSTLPCGDCRHVPLDHFIGEPCVGCCDRTGRCLPDEVDEDGNVIPPPECGCCDVFRMPDAPSGTPLTHGTGIHGQRGDDVDGTWGAIKVVARVLHAIHNPGMAVISETGRAAWKGVRR